MEESLFEIKLWIKFAVLFIPLVLFILAFAPDLKWKLMLSFAGAIGMLLALTGKSMRRR